MTKRSAIAFVLFVLISTSAGRSFAACSAVTITAPANNAPVAGVLNVSYTLGTGTQWVNLYIDSLDNAHYLSTGNSGLLTLSWDSDTVIDGSHSIIVGAYGGSGFICSNSVAITVANSTGYTRPNPTGSGVSYYVDSMNGNDSWTGKCQTQNGTCGPFKTVAKVNSTAFNPGDVVLFRSGETWRERLAPTSNGTPGNPIVFASYGISGDTGGKPTISGADLVPNSWTLVSGTSTYSQNLSGLPGGAPAQIYNVYVDGGAGVGAANALGGDPMWGLMRASCLPSQQCSPDSLSYIGPMQAGSWLYSNPTLYVWLGNSGNPNSGSQLYPNLEMVTRPSAIGGTSTNSVYGQNWVFDNLNLQRVASGVLLYGNASPGVQNVVFRRLTILQTGTGQVDDGSYFNGILLNSNLGGGVTNSGVLYDSNIIAYTGNHGNGINNQSTDNATMINNNVSHWNHHALDNKASNNVTIVRNRVHDVSPAPSGATGSNVSRSFNGIYTEADDTRGFPPDRLYYVVTQNVVDNIQTTASGTGLGIQLDATIGAGNVVANNTVYGTNIGIGAYCGSGKIYNNAIDQTASGTAIDLGNKCTGNTYEYTDDYNELGRKTDGSAAIVSGQTAGANDVANDPQFNAPAGGDFNLKTTSPCLNTGVPMGTQGPSPTANRGA